ncbi:hypothetical protein EX30DRAFT_342311 [Ascodesmis nigricans]|uniref:Uncharacterized protein n=1 Tax=Ascodesmis nigricans TaxID=341454 RepID=A0A4S2MSA1_9PEZI|nr:hypothetical protein EX30DRAFT_342311 [Ascodesmis nigricans]
MASAATVRNSRSAGSADQPSPQPHMVGYVARSSCCIASFWAIVIVVVLVVVLVVALRKSRGEENGEDDSKRREWGTGRRWGG